MDSTGIVGAIRQRLKDIELQHWMSEINNGIRRDADQNNKMRTYRKFITIESKITNVRITFARSLIPATE